MRERRQRGRVSRRVARRGKRGLHQARENIRLAASGDEDLTHAGTLQRLPKEHALPLQELGVAVGRKGQARRKAIRQVSVIDELGDAFVECELTVGGLAALEQEDMVNPRRAASARVRRLDRLPESPNSDQAPGNGRCGGCPANTRGLTTSRPAQTASSSWRLWCRQQLSSSSPQSLPSSTLTSPSRVSR